MQYFDSEIELWSTTRAHICSDQLNCVVVATWLAGSRAQANLWFNFEDKLQKVENKIEMKLRFCFEQRPTQNWPVGITFSGSLGFLVSLHIFFFFQKGTWWIFWVSEWPLKAFFSLCFSQGCRRSTPTCSSFDIRLRFSLFSDWLGFKRILWHSTPIPPFAKHYDFWTLSLMDDKSRVCVCASKRTLMFATGQSSLDSSFSSSSFSLASVNLICKYACLSRQTLRTRKIKVFLVLLLLLCACVQNALDTSVGP